MGRTALETENFYEPYKSKKHRFLKRPLLPAFILPLLSIIEISLVTQLLMLVLPVVFGEKIYADQDAMGKNLPLSGKILCSIGQQRLSAAVDLAQIPGQPSDRRGRHRSTR